MVVHRSVGQARALGRRKPVPAKWERWGSHFDAGVGRTPTTLLVRSVPYSDVFWLAHEFDQEANDRGVKLSS